MQPQPKRCGNNNKDKDNSPKTLNDKNHQASSQKFRLLIMIGCVLSKILVKIIIIMMINNNNDDDGQYFI